MCPTKILRGTIIYANIRVKPHGDPAYIVGFVAEDGNTYTLENNVVSREEMTEFAKFIKGKGLNSIKDLTGRPVVILVSNYTGKAYDYIICFDNKCTD